MRKPISVFKYRPFDEHEYYKGSFHGELFFASPSKFNDPFDCLILERYELGNKNQRIQKIQDIFKRDFPKLKMNQIRKKAKEYLRDNPNIFLNAHSMEDRIQKYSTDTLGICSLTEVPDDLLMWGHYADSFRGFCIEYDLNMLNNIFNDICILHEKLIIMDKVNYLDFYPNVNPYTQSDLERTKILLFSKSKKWKYEAEWRVVYYKNPNSIIKIPTVAIKAIYLGLNVKKEFEDYSISFALEKNLKIYKSRRKHNCYGIEFKKIE